MTEIKSFKERMAEGKRRKAEEKAKEEGGLEEKEGVQPVQQPQVQTQPTPEQQKPSEEEEQMMKIEGIKSELARDPGAYRLAVLDRLEAIYEVESNILAQMKKLNGEDDD